MPRRRYLPSAVPTGELLGDFQHQHLLPAHGDRFHPHGDGGTAVVTDESAVAFELQSIQIFPIRLGHGKCGEIQQAARRLAGLHFVKICTSSATFPRFMQFLEANR